MSGEFRLLRLADIAPRQLDWLWFGRIPLGAITIIDGDPDLGKSLVTIDIAARVSTGAAMPGEARTRTPADVIMLCSEDSPSSTVRPRFAAAGADLQRVHLVDPDCDLLLTEANVGVLESAIIGTGARLLVIDPLMNCLPDGVDAYIDQQVRTVLRPLASVARRQNASVLIVRHMTKANGGSPLKRGAGSMGIIGASRSGMTVTADGTFRVLKVAKHNLADATAGLRYELVDRDGVGVVRWCEARETVTAARTVEAKPHDDYAVVALRIARDKGSCSARDLARQLGRSTSNAPRDFGPTLTDLELRGFLARRAGGSRTLTDDGRAYLERADGGVSSSSPLSKPPVSEAGRG